MSASMKVDVSMFRRIAERCDDPALRSAISAIPRERAVSGLISQAIADNFDKSGPGWPPLKIREGMPLQKTGILKKSVTTPGAQGNIYRVEGTTITWGTNLIYAGIHNKGGVVVAKNAKYLFIPLTKKAEKVGPQKDKTAQRKSGLIVGKDMVFKKSVTIPARPFLVLRDVWKQRIFGYMVERCNTYIKQRLLR